MRPRRLRSFVEKQLVDLTDVLLVVMYQIFVDIVRDLRVFCHRESKQSGDSAGDFLHAGWPPVHQIP